MLSTTFTRYFHVVFTLPHELHTLILQNEAELYGLLFRTVAETLLEVARNPEHLGAEIGFFGILHTWGQNLLFHPHIHCVIPGGGFSPDRTHWIHPRYPFFLPIKILSKVFRGNFVAGLKYAHRQGRLTFAGSIEPLANPKCFAAFMRTLFRKDWVVYAKPAFGGPEQVLRYLGRYTHRVAISNHRLVSFDGDNVTFRWKDYARGNKQRLMRVSAAEFIRRFLVHVLPKGFVRIRHFGFMANSQRLSSMELCRKLLGMSPVLPSAEAASANSTWLCPVCHVPMIVIERLTAMQVRWRFPSQCFPRYVVDEAPHQFRNDVPPHARAEVCPQALNCHKSCGVSEDYHRNLVENGHTLQFRFPFSVLDAPHHVTTSTRIPVLSP
jgi:hypothetical protein